MKKKSEKENIIKIICPNCGCQYLPAEIYLPNSFLGKPSYIDKDHMTGEIRDFFGKTMDRHEQYTCDRCNTTFSVDCSVKFFTKIVESENFSTEYVTKYKSIPLFLEE